MRSALLLTLGANCLVMMTRLFISLDGAGAFRFTSGVLIEVLVTLAAFGGGAYLGLCVLDGDHRKMIPRRNLSQAQTLWLSLLGATMIFPATLLSDLCRYLFSMGRPMESMALSAFMNRPGADFLPRLIKSALLVPVLEEVFFRGYLHGTLKRYGEKAAMLAASMCFALVHSSSLAGMDGSLLLYTLIGMLFTLVMNRTGSITSAMLVHGCYNLALILCDYSGLDFLFCGLSPISCAVRIAGCVAFFYVMKRAWTARAAKLHESVPFGKLRRREKALLAAASAAVILAVLLLTIMGVA